jgi:acetylornithine deacetylase/succinyl-diaminopimelate desuccinylase-like protein
MPANTSSDIYLRPVELAQNLLRFDTTNPPGNEAECISYVEGLLKDAGLETTIVARDPNRPNLIARLKGRGEAPAILLHGHVDVVTTANQDWQHDPFGGEIVDGYLWGRGSIDMKGAVAMMICAVLRARAEGFVPAGDILLAVLSDEEQGGDYGAMWLVENHPELFKGVKYSFGEAGGETSHIEGLKFYPIQVGEKQICRLEATLRGPGGHGSIPMRGGAMSRLGKLLTTLDTHRLPVHITPVIETLVKSVAASLPTPRSTGLQALLDPAKTDAVLDGLGEFGRLIDPLLHNTVNATMVEGGLAVNVIPSEIKLKLDGRLLPGFTPDDMLNELHDLVGDDVEFEVLRYDAYSTVADMAVYDMLADIICEADPEGIPVPYILAGVTDGRHFARLGIKNYGFTPLLLPDDPTLVATVHAADERVPVEALDFGTNCLYSLLRRYHKNVQEVK